MYIGDFLVLTIVIIGVAVYHATKEKNEDQARNCHGTRGATPTDDGVSAGGDRR